MKHVPVDRRTRRFTLIAISIVTTLIVVRASFVRGIVFPVRIAGDSMAERLYGEHYETACRQCRFVFRFSVFEAPRGGQVVCPNCGAAGAASEAKRCPGERVFLDRWPPRRGEPRRWDLVAFETPGEEHNLAVKRVVGLPGEQIGIRFGDVLADGQIVRKSLDEFRRVALPVYDDRYRVPRTSDDLAGRWHGDTAVTRWRRNGHGWSTSPSNSQQTSEDWLVYSHRACWPGASAAGRDSPVSDSYGFNQQLSRQLHPVTDLMLACTASCSWQRGTLQFRLHDGYQWFRLELLPDEGVARLSRDGRCIREVPLPPAGYARQVLFELAVCDRQILFGVDGATVMDFVCEGAPGPPEPVSTPLAIAAEGMEVRLLSLNVLRDIYYLDPRGLGTAWQAFESLPNNQYFVVGDNVPVSRDSRHWAVPGLPSKSILGRVLCP